MTTVRQPRKRWCSCVLTLKYTFICVYWRTRQRIHNTLIVVDRYLRLMGDKTIPDLAELRLESFYPPFVAGIDLLVFGLGRIFRLDRSAIFTTEFRARLELGVINFHLKPCMFTWAKIGSPFEVIILALYSNVSSYHLISTRFLITT